MKINLKRTIFIAVISELLLMYWTHMELRETLKQDLVTSSSNPWDAGVLSEHAVPAASGILTNSGS